MTTDATPTATPPATPPVVCDMTNAPDTIEERLAEYARLFARSLAGREHTDAGIRFRFRAADGVSAWVRDLARREKQCCGFFDFTVTDAGDEVWWDVSVADDESARRMLDELYRLPDTLAAGLDPVIAPPVRR